MRLKRCLVLYIPTSMKSYVVVYETEAEDPSSPINFDDDQIKQKMHDSFDTPVT